MGQLLAGERLPHDRLLCSPMPLALCKDSVPGVVLIGWVGGFTAGDFPRLSCFLFFPSYFLADRRFATSAIAHSRALI